MARQKPEAHIIGTVKQAEAALQEIAGIERRIASHEAHMNEVIDNAKANAKALCDPLVERRKALATGLATFATLNKADLFAKRKSITLGFGTIGFRKVTRLKALAKVTMARVLERLHECGFKDAIRTKESVDKEVMRDWPDERLETVGMQRVSSDDFYYELDQEAVENAA